MNDDFLYQNRPPVRQGFGESLYSYISDTSAQSRISAKPAVALKFVLASLIVIALVLSFSEPVRAEVWLWIQSISGFDITDEAPDFNNSDAEVYFYTPQPLPNTIKDLPFIFSMPAYIPEGFVFGDDVVIANSKSWVLMSWVGTGGRIKLLVQQDWEITIPAGADSTKEIKINEQPAILIQGGWDENGKWDNAKRDLQLYWRKDGLIYSLSSSLVSDDELIKMAESIE